MQLLVFALLGLVCSIAGVVATTRNLRDLMDAPRRPINLWYVVGAIAGIAFALTCYGARYAYSDTIHVWGFPFFAALFQKDGASWSDFVGPLTIPAAIGNATFGFVLPQLLVRALQQGARVAVSSVGRTRA